MKEFFVEPEYSSSFEKLGLTDIDSVFAFESGKNLVKDNLASYRSRIQFKIDSPPSEIFLKRYDNPPKMTQLKNWIAAKKRISCAMAEIEAGQKLTEFEINIPKMVSWGQDSNGFFESRSFAAIEEIKQGQSLEKSLPDFFSSSESKENLILRRKFIERLALFIRKFHETGFRHRDLYLCHIFRVPDGRFYLIDLARVFKPMILSELYRLKDISQLHYSAPAKYFSRTDRMRFLQAYLGRNKLNYRDKIFVRKVINKAKSMARHDLRHGRIVPFIKLEG